MRPCQGRDRRFESGRDRCSQGLLHASLRAVRHAALLTLARVDLDAGRKPSWLGFAVGLHPEAPLSSLRVYKSVRLAVAPRSGRLSRVLRMLPAGPRGSGSIEPTSKVSGRELS